MNNNQDDYTVDLHHKMSKKIAQLTRVIFHLNTKNDEYEYNLRAVVSAYEIELDTLVREANTSIQKYKDSVAKMQKNDELENQMKNLQDKIDIDKGKSITEFANYKRLMEEREVKFVKESNMKIDTYKSEVEMLRNKYDGLLKNIDKMLSNNTEMSKAHKKEMADYVAEQNQKYNELLKQKLDIEDLMKEKQKMIEGLKKDQEKLLERNNQELRSQKSLNEKGLNDLKGGYEKRINDLEFQKNQLETRIKELELNEKDYKRKILELQNELNSKTKELDGIMQSTNSKGAEISILLKKITGLEEDNSKIKMELVNERNKGYMLESKMKQGEDRINGLEGEKSNMMKELMRLKEKYERSDMEKISESEKLRKEMDDLMKEITGLNKTNQSLMDLSENELRNKNKDIENLKGLIENLEKNMQELKRDQKKMIMDHNEVRIR